VSTVMTESDLRYRNSLAVERCMEQIVFKREFLDGTYSAKSDATR